MSMFTRTMSRCAWRWLVPTLLAAPAALLAQGATVERDIAYGPDPAQRLDVYRPAHAAHAPLIVMVHGGGWTRGDKGATNVVTNKTSYWVPRGYVFVSVNYRLSPQADPIEQANDVAAALAFVQHSAARWGGDASRVVLMGHSAGAHLVSLLTADPSIAMRQGATSWLGTVSLDAAGYDIVAIMRSRHLALYDPVFTKDTTLWREASPTRRLERAPVPMLLVCSTRRVISCPQARGFAAKATSRGGRVTVVPIGLTHEEINNLLGAREDYTSAVETFMRSLGLP
jgi:acetyl esterase/lipase